MRYVREVRWVFVGDPNLASRFLPLARTLIGVATSTTDERVDNSKHTFDRSGARFVITRLPEGIVTVEIDVRALQDQFKRDPQVVQMWIPRGFVIYPCSDAEPRGWGLPVQYIEDASQPPDLQELATQNLRPGLDTSRWTAGGVLGQVLLTRDEDAGYPVEQTEKRSVIQTPHYNPLAGPKPTLKGEPRRGDWQAYRLEFTDFQPQTFVSDEEGREELREWKREMYRLHNNYRESIGRERLNPPLRGQFDVAQMISDMSFTVGWNGHMTSEFYSTYKTYNDRGGKNGSSATEYQFALEWTQREKAFWYSADIIITFADSYEVQYIDPTGFPVYKVEGTVYSITPQQALDWWLGSPPHAAYIQDERWNTGYYDFSAGCMSVGYQKGAATTVFSTEGQWIQTGNKFWHSRHAEVPAVSWRGFDSENLLWETWPVRFEIQRTGEDPDYLYETVVVKQEDFITVSDSTVLGETVEAHRPRQFMYGGTKAMENSNGTNVARRTPLSGEIYMRGRAVAIAPDLGFVLAAAIHKMEGADGTATYRLIAICHHHNDQTGNELVEGMTRFVRVWWADMPDDDPAIVNRSGQNVSLPCSPRVQIRKKYGLENEGDPGPWNELNGINNWRGGQLIDVGSTGEYANDLLKYDCLWRFNDDGTRAICIRSQFKPEWFASVTTEELEGSATFVGLLQSSSLRQLMPANTDLGALFGNDLRLSHAYCEGGEPWFLELEFSHGAGSTSATLQLTPHGVGSGGRVEDRAWWFETVPVAVYAKWAELFADRDGDGRLIPFASPMCFRPIVAYYEGDQARAVYDVTSCQHQQFSHSLDDPDRADFAPVQRTVHFRGLVRAPARLTVGDARAALPSVVQYSGEVAFEPEAIMASHPCVFFADDQHLAFAAAGIAPPLAPRAAAAFDPFVERDAYALALQYDDLRDAWAAAIEVIINPEFPGLWDIAPTEAPIWRYAAWLNGQRVFFLLADNPQADYPHACLTMYYGVRLGPVLGTIFEGAPISIGWVHQRLTASHWQGGFAKDRDGEWVYAACVTRQPYGNLRRSRDDVPIPSNPAVAQWVYTWEAGTGYFLHQNLMASYQHEGNVANIGGFMTSSFADQTGLATLTLTPGENPRSFYARVV